MTECRTPYYVILNYNKPEKETSLYIDQIYGKIKSLFSQSSSKTLTSLDFKIPFIVFSKIFLSFEIIFFNKFEDDINILLHIDKFLCIIDLDYFILKVLNGKFKI